MKKTLFILASVFLFVQVAISQGYGNTMVFGYEGGHFSPNNDEYGLNLFTFSSGGLEISDDQESDLEFNDTDAAISDENGKLLFYFNGISVYDASHHLMENGDTLNEFNQFGYDLPQGAIIIPYPEHTDKYLLFYAEEGYVAPWGNEAVALNYAVIDMAQNSGLGRVEQRKIPLLMDTLNYGKLDLVRHANGRDWWLGAWEGYSNKYYRVLIDPFGVHVLGKHSVGLPRQEGIGQAYFSPDGAKYVMFAALGGGGSFWQAIDIYDFDRCSGLFSNQEHFEIVTGSSFNGGAIISPNARWLYVPSVNWLYKYDLSASPVEPTKEVIATYEPFNDPFPTKFHRGFLAPDDKIYIVTTSGSRTLHVVHRPDEPGKDCAFEQHGVRLACYNANSIPTYANYRLGPLDGSVCDSLGIDNLPVSWWRYEQDTTQHARFEFRDMSYHEPAIWSWDFGDGHASTERHPVHEYAASGAYNVCLTVSNANGSDTLCRSLSATVVTENPEVQKLIQVSPNPFASHLSVALSTTLRSPVFHLYDQLGRLVREERLSFGITEIDTEALPSGIYFWQVVSNGEPAKAGKIVKTAR